MPSPIYRVEDLEPLQVKVRDAARRTIETLNMYGPDPLDILHTLKFDARGYHPLQGHQLNLVPFPLEYALYRIFVSPVSHSRASRNPEL